MGYLRPTDGRTLCSRDCHKRRNPPSQEAGTDIWSDFGTPLRAPATGTVYEVGGNVNAATGYFVTIDLDDGRRIRYLHLWDRYVSKGQRVFRGTIFAQSGGSGYGDMYAAGGAGTVGRHVHVTLWPTHAYSFGTNANVLDFEAFADPVGTPANVGPATPIESKTEQEEYPEMFYAVVGPKNANGWYLVTPVPSDGKPMTAIILGANAVDGGFPVIKFEWQNSIDRLKSVCAGIYH